MVHTDPTEEVSLNKPQQDSITSSIDPVSTDGKQPEEKIIEYVYNPPKGKGKTQRVCGILGKDKAVSRCITPILDAFDK